ncbi:MAG: hypothetical protein K0V04_39675, partial [Deltaproteobacteria bacterium]|nr:hypothetical protein [Deltaproteobacteria bacterium]
QGRQVLAERRRWQEAAQRHLEGRPAAEAAQSRATEAEQRTTSALAAAEAAASAIEQGGDAQSRLARQALETRRLELASKYAEAHAQLLHAEKVQAMATEVETLQQRREALEQDRRAAERSTNEAEAARREAEAERRLYESALDLRRWQQARARVQRAETSEAEAERLLAKAQDSTTRAQAVDNRLAATALPAAETVEQWRALAEERRVMRARLEVGLSLVVQRDDARTIAAGADDAEPRSVEAGATVDAQRTIAVRIGDEIELAIVGGDARSRAAHQAVEQRWADEVAPALERLDAADLAGLRQRIEQADDERHQAERWRAEATAMRREAEIHSERAAELPALRSTMDANAKALASVDRQALEERTADYDETTLDQRRTSAEARGQEAQHRHAQARARTQSLASELQVRASEHDRLAAALTEATAKLPGDPVSVAEAAFDRRSAIEGEQETVSEQVAALDEAQARLRAEADAAVVEARTEVDRARVAAAAATAALDERREKLAQAEGRLAQLEAQARDIDESALEQALTERVEALDSIAEPTVVVTAEALEQAETERNGRQQRVREVGAELDQQRGALKHVGGAVAREEAGRIDHALETAKQAERDLELDYEAWRMLTETLREAETAEGRHLGEVLGEPVHDRFAALTEGRYGALSLGRDLQAQGLEVAGDLRDVTRLSEGVQEQLATILRLAIAEQLGTALVLDDHLVQTDPSRVAWFREVLREVSDRVQVVVLTCRPEDYTSADERPAPGDASRQTDGMLAVDLTQVIRRA